MRAGRRLTREEAALWAKVTGTVEPLEGRIRPAQVEDPPHASACAARPRIAPRAAKSAPQPVAAPRPPAVAQSDHHRHGLDAGWDRKLARGLVEPDFTLDLHGCTLDAAHGRLLHGLGQAKAMGARLVLLVTGNPRPVDAADRGSRRGAIRAKVIDWLSVSDHATDIAAIRGAHRRHGGQGALYIVLKRRR